MSITWNHYAWYFVFLVRINFLDIKDYYFYYPCNDGKVLLRGQIFEIGILMDLHGINFPVSENQIFKVLSVYIGVCVCVCYQDNSKIIRTKTWNSVFYICIRYALYLKLLKRSEKKSVYRGKRKKSNTLKFMERIPCNWIFAYLDCNKHIRVKIHFFHAQKYLNNRKGYKWRYCQQGR